MSGGDPIVIANAEGARTTPSVVAITEKGERLVGRLQSGQAITNPENTIFSVKRLMGRKFRSSKYKTLSNAFPIRCPRETMAMRMSNCAANATARRRSPP